MTEIISPAKPWYFTTSTLIILINTTIKYIKRILTKPERWITNILIIRIGNHIILRKVGENYNRKNYETFFFAWHYIKLDPSVAPTINCDDLYWIFFQQNNSLLREKSLQEFNKNTWPQILQEIPKHAQRRKEFMVISPLSLLNIEEAT